METKVKRFWEDGCEVRTYDSNKTLKEMLLDLMDVNQEYLDQEYDGDMVEFVWNEIGGSDDGSKIVFIVGKKRPKIDLDSIDEDFDFEQTIQTYLESL